MAKTLYDTFKDFPSFYQQLKPRFIADFRIKDLITNIAFSSQVYNYYKNDRHYDDSDAALNKIMSQIVFDCAEIRKKELIWSKVFNKLEELREIETKTETRNQKEQITKNPKTTTTYNEPLMALQDLASGAFGYHNRADWLKTTQKNTGDITITQKEGMKVIDKEGKVKSVPNWTKTETEDNAGIARILTAFQYIEIDLSKYLIRYKKFFYRSYGLEGQVEYNPTTKRHIFKDWEEIEEEQKPEEERKPKIATEEPELSFNEWKKKFKEEHPGEKPTFQLYTIERLEKRKEQLLKELKKTSGVFKDKLNLRLTFTEALIEGLQKRD